LPEKRGDEREDNNGILVEVDSGSGREEGKMSGVGRKNTCMYICMYVCIYNNNNSNINVY